MPELPEVETVARSLAPLVCGRRVRHVRICDEKLADLPVRRLQRRTIRRVFRLGKQVLLELTTAAGNALWVGVHLRMTGRLLWLPSLPDGASAAAEMPHLRVLVSLDGGKDVSLQGGELAFQDTRRFGTMVVYDSLAAARPVGLDPTRDDFTVDALREQLGRGSGTQPLKTWLLRQDRLVGLGNIYASEILWHAGLRPTRGAGSLRRAQIERLWRATRDVLAAAIEACGTTFSDFQSAQGVSGSYQRTLRVYGREGEACVACGGDIERLVMAQRSTFFCRRCQR